MRAVGPRAPAATSSSTACWRPKPSPGYAKCSAIKSCTVLRYHLQSTKPSKLRFRALLTDGAREVRFEKLLR